MLQGSPSPTRSPASVTMCIVCFINKPKCSGSFLTSLCLAGAGRAFLDWWTDEAEVALASHPPVASGSILISKHPAVESTIAEHRDLSYFVVRVWSWLTDRVAIPSLRGEMGRSWHAEANESVDSELTKRRADSTAYPTCWVDEVLLTNAPLS